MVPPHQPISRRTVRAALRLTAALALAALFHSPAAGQEVFRIEKSAASKPPDTAKTAAAVKVAADSGTGKKAPVHDTARASADSAAGTSAAKPAAPVVKKDSVAVRSVVKDSAAVRTFVRDSAIVKTPVHAPGIPAAEEKRRASQGRPAWYAAAIPGTLLFLASLTAIALTVVFIVRRRMEQQRFMTSTRLSIMDKEVQRACRCIERAYRNPKLSAEDVSRELVTGAAFLQALFARELGMSIEDFIEQVRVNRVKMALQEQPDPDPALLAREAGFESVEAMEGSFREIAGTDTAHFAKAVHGREPRGA